MNNPNHLKERYKAAERFMPWNADHAVLNGDPMIRWADDTHYYYPLEYREDDTCRIRWIKADAVSLTKEPLFDHQKLSSLLNEEDFVPEDLEVKDSEILFEYKKTPYSYDLKTGELKEREKTEGSESPNGRYEVLVKDHNLVLKDKTTNEEKALTTDGVKDFDWGSYAQYSGYITMKLKGIPEKPGVLWSPDSRYFLTYKLDQRKVKELYILQSYDEEGRESIRPRLITYKCPFPEDEDLPLAYYYLYDLEKQTMIELDAEPVNPGGALLSPRYSYARWLPDSSAVYTTIVRRSNKSAAFYIFYNDGKVRKVLEESSDTFLNIQTFGELDGFEGYPASNFLTDDGSTVFWQSERDGFARLYRYDVKTGECLGPVTPEKTIVGAIKAKDEKKQRIYYMASGLEKDSDPYYQHLCASSFDGKSFKVLTPEDGMHNASVHNGFIIDTWSRVDKAPVTVLRKINGTLLKEIVKADISDLMNRGYITPIRFTVTASDGHTPLYGILIMPADYEEGKLYPFVDYIYGGMQCYNVPKEFTWKAHIEGREMFGGLEALAQTGIAGIILDGLGTPGRGKEIHNVSWQNIHGCAGLKDHVYCLKELKEKFPFLDLDRAGIWGNSGGGCATSRAMLEYPGVYKAGVSSAGNHDQRMYNNLWTENYYGPYDEEIYKKGDNTALAANLEGHILLVHGAMDDNVAMSQTIRLTDALIKANKDFDFFILPRVNHNVPADPYFVRRKLEYFVKHLLNESLDEPAFALPEE